MATRLLLKVQSETHADTDSDPSEEMPLAARATAIRTVVTATAMATPAAGRPSTANTTSATASTITPSTVPEPPPPAQVAADASSPNLVLARIDKKRSHKKKGRNQYTRDREEDSPARSQSRDIQKEDHGPTSNNNRTGGEHTKSNARLKGGMSSKITMTDMKRKAAALLDYISRTQVDLAAETMPETGANTPKANGGSAASAATSEKNAEDRAEGVPPLENEKGTGSVRLEKDFKELNCLEMMDSLARKLVKWQQEYAS